MIEYFIAIKDSDNPVNLSKRQQDEVVACAMDEWREWETATQGYRDRAREARQLYLENLPQSNPTNSTDDAYDSAARVRRPVLAQSIDATVAQQHAASYPTEERFFNLQPRNEMAKEKQDVYSKHLEQRLSEVDFLINTLKDRKNLMLDGTSLVWHPFMRKTMPKIKYSVPMFLGMRMPRKPKKEKVNEVVFEGTGYVPVSFDDWLVDPFVDSFDEATLIWRRWMNPEELKAIKGIKNKDLIDSHTNLWSSDKYEDKRLYFDQMGLQMHLTDEISKNNKNCLMLYEKWGDFWIDGKFYENHVLIFSNEGVFHYFGENPYDHGMKPFTVSPYIPMPNTLYGKSLAQDIIPLCHALDTMLNQALDCLSVTGNPAFTYLIRDDVLTEYFKDGVVRLRAGEGLPVSDHNSINPIVWDRSVLAELGGFMQQAKDEIRESTGGVSYATGGTSSLDQDRTATETSILATGTETRFMLLVQCYEEFKSKKYMRMTFENDRQFMTTAVSIDDEDTILEPLDVKLMDLDIDVTGSHAVMSKNKESQELDTFFTQMLPALVQADIIELNGNVMELDVTDLAKRRLSLGGIKNLSNIVSVKTKEEQMEEAQEGLGSGINENILQQTTGLGENPAMAGVIPMQGMGAA